MRSSFVAAAFLPLLCYAAPQERAPNPTVSIASGVVVGTATAVSNQPSVTGLANAYLGVPFAQSPPVRFAPPEAPKAWSSPLVAQTLPPACLQQFLSGEPGAREREYFNNPLLPPPPESEDCLYLNVFAPQDASPTNLKPVMFWIYGGNNQIGTASLAYYNGSSLAVNEGVVVVVINYRTNMFGFSNSPEIPFGQQNSGYLDQRFALQWVQENIEQFGGDPTKVTLFGESAGAYGIKQLLANPPSPLPFRAAILESQQALATGNGTANYEQVLEHFGCTDIECLRGVPAQDILAYNTANSLTYSPVLDDGTNVASNTLPSIKSGKFANVPILIGTNLDEFSVFAAILGLRADPSNLNQVLGAFLGNSTEALLATYTGKVANGANDLVTRALTDFAFTCTTRAFSNAVASRSSQPVWRYRYDASFPNTELFPNAGAYHSSEIPYVWGTYPLENDLGPATPTQVALSKYMQGVWAGFAKNPSAGPGWPALRTNLGKELGILGGKDVPAGEETVPLLTADYPCLVIEPLLIAIGNAY